jgi:DNA-binding transcriptional LysR family regulator
MHGIDGSIDLNLLLALDALLAERSVRRAAARLGLSPSATSHALNRCRALVGDPLLVRSGRGLVPTPRAEALAPEVASLVARVRWVLRGGPDDPRTRPRRVSVVCPDLLAPFVPDLWAALTAEAPSLDLELVAPGPRGVAATVLDGPHDLGLGAPPPSESGLRARRLGTLRFALVVRRDHPLGEGSIAPDDWVRWPHVVVRTGDPGRGFVGDALAAAGLERRVGLTVPSFLLAVHAVSRTDLVFAGPRPSMAPLCAPLGLALLDLPLPLDPIPVVCTWPEALHADPGHRWLRERVAEVIGAALRE